MREIRWGMIGCGDVTEKKSGPAFQKIVGSRLIAVMRRDEDKAKDYAMRHDVPKWYDNAVSLINDPDINAIYIATPPDVHAEYTLKAASAGKPVYVEKPMARNYEECKLMIKGCRDAGVPLFVAYYRRCMPSFVKVKQLVDSGAVGQVLFVNTQLYWQPRKEDLNTQDLPWRVLPEISGGGYFMDVASHQLDFLDYVFGPIISVEGIAVNRAGLYPAEDTVSASFVFESGLLGNGIWCFAVAAATEIDRTEIVGTKGKIVFVSFESAPIELEINKRTQQFNVDWPEHVQQPLIQTVVDELQGKGKSPSTGVTGARTNLVIDKIIREYYRKRRR